MTLRYPLCIGMLIVSGMVAGCGGGEMAALCDALLSAPWLVLVTRRDSEDGFVAPDHDAVARIELGPLSREDTMRLAESTPAAHVVPPHLLDLAVDRRARFRAKTT